MNKQDLIGNYAAGVNSFLAVINGIPEESYDFIPKGVDAWTIRQHIIHLVDCETNNFIRIKSCIAQPYSNVYVINESDWTRNLDNRKEDITDYLSLFSLLRRIMSSFLESVPESEFKEKYFIREYNQEVKKITLSDAVEMYCNHIQFHIEYINKIFNE